MPDHLDDLLRAGLELQLRGDPGGRAAGWVGHPRVLDEVTEPRLLHGDLWTVNVMMESGAPEPTITGVVDNDRTSWGDPESDWTIFMAARKHQMRDVLDQLQA